MTFETQSHATPTMGRWKSSLVNHPLLRLVFVSLLAALAAPNAAWGQVEAAPPISGVIGKVPIRSQ